MTVQHNVVHKFAAGLNTSKNSAPLKFDLPVQQGWKVYYEGINDGAVRVDDAYWLVAANGGGTLTAGDEHSLVITGDGTAYSGYSFYRTLADRELTSAGKKFYMETRVMFTIASGGTVPANGWFVGYTNAAEAMTTGTVDAITCDEAVGFGHADTATSVSFYSRADAVNQTISIGADLPSGTYVKLACYYDGGNFHLYRDDQLVSSTAMATLNVDEGMTPQVFFEVVEAKANTFDIQYLLLATEV